MKTSAYVIAALFSLAMIWQAEKAMNILEEKPVFTGLDIEARMKQEERTDKLIAQTPQRGVEELYPEG